MDNCTHYLSFCICTHSLVSLRCVWSGNENELFAGPISITSFRDLILPHETERQSDNRPMLYCTSWIIMTRSVVSIQMDLKLHQTLGVQNEKYSAMRSYARCVLHAWIVFMNTEHLNNWNKFPALDLDWLRCLLFSIIRQVVEFHFVQCSAVRTDPGFLTLLCQTVIIKEQMLSFRKASVICVHVCVLLFIYLLCVPSVLFVPDVTCSPHSSICFINLLLGHKVYVKGTTEC